MAVGFLGSKIDIQLQTVYYYGRYVDNTPQEILMKWYVYHILDPHTKAVRYVGFSEFPERKLAMYRNRLSNMELASWIHRLQDEGTPPLVITISEHDSRYGAELAERISIQDQAAAGAELFNRAFMTTRGYNATTPMRGRQ